ncbi:MAG: hypothetical protein Tsb009_33290 [Planctomycetaceae bacterium]
MESGDVDVWNLKTKRKVYSLRNTSGSFDSIAFSTDGSLLGAASEGVVYNYSLWESDTGRLLKKCKNDGKDRQTLGACSLTLLEGGKNVATLSYDGTVKIWDTVQGKYIRTAAKDDNDIYSAMAVFHKTSLIAVGGWRGNVQIVSVNRKRKPQVIAGRGQVTHLEFTPDGKYLAISHRGQKNVRLVIVK